MRECNNKSYATRRRYKEAGERFCAFLAEEYGVRKFKNGGKHIEKWVSHQLEENAAISTIKTDLAGLRFLLGLAGAKGRIPTNQELKIPRRANVGKVDRAVLKIEYRDMLAYSKSVGRMDFYHCAKICAEFGARIEGANRITAEDVYQAYNTPEIGLKLTEKGGLTRYIRVSDNQKEALQELLAYAEKIKRKGADPIIPRRLGRKSVQQSIKSIGDFYRNHQANWVVTNYEERSELRKEELNGTHIGSRPNTEKTSMHSLRYFFLQNEYERLRCAGFSKAEAMHETAKAAGHGRSSVSYIYVSPTAS